MSDFSDNPFESPSLGDQRVGAGQPQPVRQSGFGIASFVISIIAGLTLFGLLLSAGIMASQAGGQINEESPVAIMLGLGIIGVLGIALLGFVLGIAGMFHPRRARVFSVLGLLFNGLVIAGFVGIMFVGLAMS